MLVRSLPMKSRKRLARDAFNTFTAHSSLAHDVTDTECRAQTGGTHNRVFRDFKTSIFNK